MYTKGNIVACGWEGRGTIVASIGLYRGRGGRRQSRGVTKRGVTKETRGGAENEGVDEKQKRLHRAIRRVVDALAALVAATHKNGAHRARLFAPGVFAPGSDDPPGDHAAAAASSLPGVLSSSPALASSLAVADALCRLSCNLGAGVGDDGGGERASRGRAAWREALEARLSRLDAAEAKRLARRFAAEERCAPTARDGATHAWLAGMLKLWLDDEWSIQEPHRDLGMRAAEKCTEMRLEGCEEMGSLVMGIAQDLLSFDFSDTFVNSFEVANKTSEILMMREGYEVCCLSKEDETRQARYEEMVANGQAP